MRLVGVHFSTAPCIHPPEVLSVLVHDYTVHTRCVLYVTYYRMLMYCNTPLFKKGYTLRRG